MGWDAFDNVVWWIGLVHLVIYVNIGGLALYLAGTEMVDRIFTRRKDKRRMRFQRVVDSLKTPQE